MESLRRAALSAATLLLFNYMCAPAFAEDEDPRAVRRKISSVPQAIEVAKDEKNEMPEIRYQLGKQPTKDYSAGRSNEASALNFPISKGMAGVSMFLKPGGLRELHWHANAAEWAYVLKGRCRITVIDPQGRSEVKDFGPGDVWYFPRGHGHSIQALGDEECHFLLVFDNGYFSEFSTFSMSDWIAQTPKEVLAKEFGMPVSAFDDFPKKEVYIAQGLNPSKIAPEPPDSPNPPPLTHRFKLGEKTATSVAGGSFNLVSQKEFPISTTMSGAILKLKPLAIREMHWHPNADEWQYYIKGRARMTVFGSEGKKITREFEPGDVGYVPMGYGHYIESIGEEDCEMLAVFNNGNYEEISLSSWLASNPSYVLEANLGLSKDIVEGLRKKQEKFSIPGATQD